MPTMSMKRRLSPVIRRCLCETLPVACAGRMLPLSCHPCPEGVGLSSQVESAPAGPAELRVSLDRDLLNGTLALEAFWQALRKDWRVLRYAPAAFAGLPGTAATLLEAGDGPQIETLPYDGQVVDRLKAAQAAGQRVVMTTAGTEAFAGRVAQHLGCMLVRV